jgi:ABC-2 type transport system permease protein
MTGYGILLGKELLEQWRTRRLLVVAIVFAAFGLGSPLLARYTPELVAALAGTEFEIEIAPPTIADSIAQILRNLGQTGVLAAILLAMGSVASEKERGTAALLLTKPASRAAFLIAKATGLLAILAVGVVLGTVAGYIYTVLLFDTPDAVGYAGMAFLLLLQLAAYAAITFLGSTLTRSAVAAAAAGVGALVLIAIVAVLPTIGDFTPGTLLEPAAAWALGDTADDAWRPIVGTLALIGLAIGASLVSFRRQEL